MRDTIATTEARRALPRLVKEMGAKRAPSADPMDDAVGIGRHRKGGAVLMPAVDALAVTAEMSRLRERIEQLEGDLEDAGLALYLQERLATTTGRRLGAEEFLRAIGMASHVERLPRR